MAVPTNIIGDWFSRQSPQKRIAILDGIASTMHHRNKQPLEKMASELAASLMAVCAEDLGLSSLEMAGLLAHPKKDAIASLVTVLRGG